MKNQDYSILLYYGYTPISDPKTFRLNHHLFCLSLDLRGRIIIASEGINGTLSGLKANCQTYMAALKQDKRFENIDFKIDQSQKHVFKKLNVRYKKEIVNSGLVDLKPYQQTGQHLSTEAFKKIKDEEDTVLLDVRSNYEHRFGKFKNAKTLNINHFREFPEKIKDLEVYKDQKIITYCTGGVKCEKASAFLLENGFQNVYQLHGGIIKYGIEEKGEGFEGMCYVFDDRVNVNINQSNPTVISTCCVCGQKSKRMANCANPTCNKHAIICQPCGIKMEGACSETCKKNPNKRPYNDRGFYPKTMNGYNPNRCSKR